MFNKYIEEIDNYLKECFEDKRFWIHSEIKEAMSYTTLLPSKKLRAILCLETSKIFSNDYKRALPMASAIEMLHSQSLIHDDLPSMDNDDFRRSKPANHKVFGEAIAILAGDALISYGAQTIIEKTPDFISKENILKIVNLYLNTAGAFGIVGGQVADIQSEGKKITIDELEFIHTYKTAAMFELAIVSGAILGGADGAQIDALRKFARTYGYAFQIRDDIIDVIKTTEELGKTAGKDEKGEKSTYVTLFGLENAKEKLNSLIGECYDIISVMDIESDVYREILEKLGKLWFLATIFLGQVLRRFLQAFLLHF